MSDWLTLHCERVLYVDRGRDVILCDRLPHPVTLVVKLSAIAAAARERGDAKQAPSEGPQSGAESASPDPHTDNHP